MIGVFGVEEADGCEGVGGRCGWSCLMKVLLVFKMLEVVEVLDVVDVQKKE